MAGFLRTIQRRMADAFRINGASGNPHFEAASQSRRMRGFNPARNHINRAIEASGETLVARSRWLYDNEGIYGSAVDEWVSAAVSDGIKPHPRIRGHKKSESALLDLWWHWVDEADYEGEADYYGMQATIARETFIAGECFVRTRTTDPASGLAVPLQLEIYPTEMLDVTYDAPAEIPGNYIRMGIEFDRQASSRYGAVGQIC